ncbi:MULTISPECIES: hypothetical protein [Haloferax]|uniref:DUF7969 domain-containing protein n=2 Tax=Haloferax gibbonsii TaxID=35746 RepID=A0A0K1IWQ5_HALGI|nr:MULTISPECIES: hypothetical protein [Haloferax]AKU08718.1 hypothetical protein ABY42_13595 [Haloferax gibbonsii]ELZ81148.1 hypothetical protein C454_08891 [Haloferax gibbonsii ATCC 33959]QOS12110.1 uncharacterized protein HfgLR_09855 [Haloferax gibbonsii]RDZ52144.1 hypothetical protein C5C07_10135 [Haloferax sp. Atlit-4N]REA01179.1 hypothetical protein DEQ92_17660 [Haloferax sp. Atlit-6N]
MGFPVSYYCPHCGAVVELERDGYLADKSVTPYPLEGWSYADPTDDFEDAEGVRFACGESDAPGLSWTGDVVDADDVENPTLASPCGREFYLSFVRYEDGREVEAVPESDYVVIGGGGPSGPSGPRGPDAGPRGPDGF